MPGTTTILDAGALQRALARIGHEILERNPESRLLALVGLPTRRFPLAQRLAAQLQDLTGHPVPVGQLDISFHRDDLDRHTPIPHLTEIPFDVQDKHLVLVDDVLFTGRSVRAALNALVDLGRPTVIQLVALIDRGHRQLPIRADFVGKNVPTALTDEVVVNVREVDGRDAVEVRHV
jgi:pyrimidine operon attenuation protein/uracil phosphoribosyltransferase